MANPDSNRTDTKSDRSPTPREEVRKQDEKKRASGKHGGGKASD